MIGIAQGFGASDVGADEVTLDRVVRCVRWTRDSCDRDAEAVITRDDVSGLGRRSANCVVRRVGDRDAVGAIAQEGSSIAIGADVVAQNQVARRTPFKEDTVKGVARDDIVCTGSDPPIVLPEAWLSISIPFELPRCMPPTAPRYR